MVKLPQIIQDIIDEYEPESGELDKKSQLNSFFWSSLEDLVRKKIQGGRVKTLELDREEILLMDFGVLHPKLIKNSSKRLNLIRNLRNQTNQPANYFHFSQWMNKQYELILKNDKKGEIQNVIKLQEQRTKALEREILFLQEKREQVFSEELKAGLESQGRFDATLFAQSKQQCSHIRETDNLFRQCELTRLQVLGGKFLNNQEKREFISCKETLQSARDEEKKLMDTIGSGKVIKEIGEINKQIESNVGQVLDLQKKTTKSKNELKALKNEVANLTSMEIENSLNEILRYNRDLVRLCAKRKRSETISVLNGEVEPMSFETIQRIMRTVIEFDSNLFKNDRCRLFGAPGLVIVPGYGDGTYDWKYNALILPAMPYRTPDLSIFSAVVEYRLDCDEDKTLLTSYNKLKENAGIRSTFRLKIKFIKDYVAFMNSETKGYKVLPKNIRHWFEREIAPKKNQIRVPLEYDPLLMSHQQFEALTRRTLTRISQGDATAEDFFIMGIIYEFSSEEENALNSFIKAIIQNNRYLEAIFNAGIISLRVKDTRAAAKFFSRYIKLEPQSWWSAVCHEYLIKMR